MKRFASLRGRIVAAYIAVALSAVPTASRSLRRGARRGADSDVMPAPLLAAFSVAQEENGAVAIAARQNQTPTEIHEKWDKMDEFLKIMFTIACKWKHGKDVNGLAADKLAKGELEPVEIAGFKAQIQADNLQALSQACGKITAGGKERCRLGCGDRWGNAAQRRSECDRKCIDVYTRFQRGCNGKVENLKKVYEMKLSQSTAKKRCYEGFCADFPTVWMNENTDGMKAELDAQCVAQCTQENIDVQCERKWLLEVDFIKANLTQSCFEQGQVRTCFDGKKAVASTAQESCSSGGKQDCEAQFEACKIDGKVDTTYRDAKNFCEERRKLCRSQVKDRCLSEFRSALDQAEDECQKGDSSAFKACEEDGLTKAQQQAFAKCSSERGATCPHDCRGKCDVEKLGTCLGNLQSDGDVAGQFCEDFWHLLHDSSEVDPLTGNPIVLLAQ